MSRPGRPPPALPLELLNHVVDYLDGDNLSLQNCALTCHALLWRARGHLFREISLRGMLSQRFARLADANLRIALLVRSVKIYDIELWTLPEKMLRFSLLANLRSLIFYRATFEFLDSLFQILDALPALEYLACHDMTAGQFSDYLGYDTDGGGHLSGLRPPTPDPRPFCPKLRTLVVKHGYVDQDAFARRFMELGVSEHLESLDVSFGATDRHLHWIPVVRAARGTLQHLSMSVSEERISHTLRALQQYDDPYTFVGNALAGCAVLTSLCLKHRPEASPREVEPLHFLKAFCELFERPEVPLPALEQLTLGMVDRDGQMVSAEPHVCTRLARALLSRTRYPRFRAIVVGVQSQSYARYNRTWRTRGLVGEQKQELLDRWRAAFADFEGHSGVSLDVNLTL
ncbi:hypothetical protein K466DRAFT_601742 [Polyporus arcularius HHB13444]|uniref:F-box domain-containing protein n=1 Tax=Polyporus arcularius HHB13444 TaxID=1314778 RepID=A0A5C3P772_9APHY|nr:hypothetical protein K466DRAFT_601742 [Polyporus arcularius HHB13444]